MRRIFALFGSLFAALVISSSAHAAYTAHYVFGDSLSDTGNFNALTGGALPTPYWNGRFTNGPVYAEIVSASLGLAIDPFYAGGGGTNYAIGGARTDGHSFAALAPIANLQAQLGAYMGSHGGVADSGALYTVYIGSNDVFDAIDAVASTGDLTVGLAMVQAAADRVGQALDTLTSIGAKTILAPTLTNLGLTPLIPTAGKPLASALAAGFNSIVDGYIQGLLSTHSDLRIVRPDIFGLLNDAVTNPANYGITNTSVPCYDGFVVQPGTTVCGNPDETLFWDLVHPTAAGHQFIADTVLVALPEPQALLLVGLALGLMVAARRRRV